MEDMGELKKRKIIKTRKEIISHAFELFKEKGYDNVTLDEIAQAAILSRATLYNYYQNKETIYYAIHIEQLKRNIKKLDINSFQPLSGKEILLILCTQILRSLNENWIYGQIINKFLTKNARRDNIARRKYEERKKNPNYEETKYKDLDTIMADYLEQILLLQEKWENVLRIGIQDGSIKSELPPLQLINYIFVLLNGIMDQKHLKQIALEDKDVQLDYETIEKLTLNLVKFLLQ